MRDEEGFPDAQKWTRFPCLQYQTATPQSPRAPKRAEGARYPVPQSHTSMANDVANACSRLARLIDYDYAESCLDTSMTNRAPISDREALVSLLEGVGHLANYLTDPEVWSSDFDREPRTQVPWGYLTGHGWGLPRRSGLPEGWASLPARRLVVYLTARPEEHQFPGAINERDREAILEELDRRDPS